MRENSSAPKSSPEGHIMDANTAFDPEARQAQAQMDIYAENRPYKDGDGVTHDPQDNPVVASEYFDGQRQIADEHSPAHKEYEDMSLVELASKLGEAEYHGDRTIEQDVGDILLDRLAVEEEKIKSDTYFREGNPTEALWKSVMGIAEKKVKKLEEEHGKHPADNGDQPSDGTTPPYDWEAEGAFEPVKEEEQPKHVTSGSAEPLVGPESGPDESGPRPVQGPGESIPDSAKVAEHPPGEDGSYEIELRLKQDPRFTPERIDAIRGLVDPAWQEKKENGENQIEITEYLGSYAEGGMDSLEDYMKTVIKKHIWQYKAKDGEQNILSLDEVAFPAERREQLKSIGIQLDEAGMLEDIDPVPSRPEAQTQPAPEMPPPEEPPDNHETAEKGLRIEVGYAEQALKGEDSIVVNEAVGIFGVFDGLGGMGRGDEASKAAASAIETKYSTPRQREPQTPEQAVDDAKHVLAEARMKASQTGGHTTAVFAKIEKIAGKDYLIWGNAGDSRMIMQQADGRIVDISTDQSEGNMVQNELGPHSQGAYEEPTLRKLDEFGSIELQPDDRVMLCSDGITGDWEDQFLTREEFEDAFSKRTAQESAARFLELSKKFDDKSVIVIDAIGY